MGHLVVVEGEPGGPVPKRVRSKVQAPRHDPSLELGHPIPPVPHRPEEAIEIREEEAHGRRVGGDPLLQTHERRLPAELPRPEQVEPMVLVGQGPLGQPVDGVRHEEDPG